MKIMIDIDKKTMKNLKTIYIKNGVSEEPVNITEIVRKVANGKPVRKSKWEVVKERLADGTEIPVHNEVCSVCGHSTKYRFPYCPWCGAEMWEGD